PRRTRRCSEREPAVSLRDKLNVTGGWLPSLAFAFGVASGFMLCERCHKNEATVHLTKKKPSAPDRVLHLCTVCFPPEAGDDEQAARLLRLFSEDLPNQGAPEEK